jgi:MFS family permease
MEEVRWERFGGLAGLVFVILFVISAFIAGQPPEPTDAARKIHEFYEDHERALKAGAFLSGVGAIAFLWFLGSLWSTLRRQRLATVAAGGGVLTLAFALASSAITSTTALRIGELAPRQAKFFHTLQAVVITMAAFSIAALVAATSIAALRAKVFPAWLGWAGAVLALAWLAAGVGVASERSAVFNYGFVVFLVWLVWVLVISFFLFRPQEQTSGTGIRGRPEEPTAPTT